MGFQTRLEHRAEPARCPVRCLARLLCVLMRLAFPVLFLVSLEGCNAQQAWPLWEAYTHHFLDDQGRVIDRTAGDRTTSEGQAYAMFFSLVDNDRAHFEKVLDWTQDNLAQGDLTTHLPAWEWGKNSQGEWKTLDGNSAADADLWMAYTLIEAGRLWSEPRFASLGRMMANQIAREEVVLVPGLGTTLLPGKEGFHPEPDRFLLNPSYLPLPVLAGLAKTLPQGPWAGIAASLPGLMTRQQANGFAMDWLSAGPDGIHAAPSPAQANSGARAAQPVGSYDAIRVYLWLGMTDAATPGRRELLDALPGMDDSLKTAAAPPLEVDASGKVVQPNGPVGFSAAVIPYLLAYGSKSLAKVQADRVQALRDPSTNLYGPGQTYYDQNLALFSMGWTEQRFRFNRDGTLHVRWK